jgi:hypothetical protein
VFSGAGAGFIEPSRSQVKRPWGRPTVNVDRVVGVGGWLAVTGWALDSAAWSIVVDGAAAPVLLRYPRPDVEAATRTDEPVHGWLVLIAEGARVQLRHGRDRDLTVERTEPALETLLRELVPHLGTLLDQVGWEPTWARLAVPLVQSMQTGGDGRLEWVRGAPDSGSREARWQALRASRERLESAHPFSRDQLDDPAQTLFDDGPPSDVVLVTFAGFADKLSIPAAEFFEAVAVPCRRIYIRQLDIPFEPHVLGTSVEEVAASISDRIAGNERVVFAGSSLGAYIALVYATLCGADSVFALSPTTTVRPPDLAAMGDQRWSVLETQFPPQYLDDYGDLLAMWRRHKPPRVVVHFPYRNDVLRQHAERIAEVDGVSLTPHYEHAPMYKISNNGTLTATLTDLLKGA